MIYFLSFVFFFMCVFAAYEVYRYMDTRKPVHAAFFVFHLMLAAYALCNYVTYIAKHAF